MFDYNSHPEQLFDIVTMIFSNLTTQPQPLMIAHAGGGINGQNYSNSIEALEINYTKGFRYFEIDFSWTSDGELVCLHDWGTCFEKIFGVKTTQALSLNLFEQQLNNTAGLHPCTPETLDFWLISHPDAFIISDVKTDNIKAIKYLTHQFPYLTKQLIPQFYQPREYSNLKSMGFKQLIWILYQYEGKFSSVIKHAKDMDLFAVSMRASQAKKKCAQQLMANGQDVFVYTVNKQKTLKKLVNTYQVSGIYTDFLNVSGTHSED